MNKSLTEKEKLMSMLTEIYDQLEELELVLESSFTEQRLRLNDEELYKISAAEQKLSVISNGAIPYQSPDEKNIDLQANNSAGALRLEFGF